MTASDLIVDYTIVEGSIDEVIQGVEDMIRLGWKLQGGISCYRTHAVNPARFFQALVKEKL